LSLAEGLPFDTAGPISLTVITVPGCIVPTIVAPASSSFKHPALTGPTTLTMPTARVVRMVALQISVRGVSTAVYKSPSLSVAEKWLSTVVSTVSPTVSKTICFG